MFSIDERLLRLLRRCITFIFIVLMCSTHYLYAGITGTLSGQVFDKQTGQILPGAAIFVEGTTMGAMADKNGFYTIHNLPAGTYDVSVRMIGYSKVTIKDVRINVDLDTELNFHLSTEVLPLNEVLITKERQLIQSEITSSTYFVSGDEIHKNLPIDSYHDAIAFLPGVVGNHIRGGRETDVLYLLDGLPLQGALSREVSSTFPNSSIVEMMVQTGGFTAEYGHAGSGIINVVSKQGRNHVEGDFKLYTDFFDTGLTGSDNTRRMELNLGGPMTIGFGGPLINANYFVSADLNLSDSPFREELQDAFDSPVFTNYNINSKLTFDIATNTTLNLQGLLSNWKWRRFDPQWELNLDGLAQHEHYSHRLSASLTHTFSPRLFASVRAARYAYKRNVLGDVEAEEPNLVFEDPTDPDSHILLGRQPWEEETQEHVNFLKFDLVAQLTSHHLLKTGLDYQGYNLNSKNTRFRAVPGRNVSDPIQFSKISNDFVYEPQFYALYLQDKFEFKGVTANLGLRYDVFEPDIAIDEPTEEFKNIRRLLKAPGVATKSEVHKSLSPRLGISLPLSETERVHVNYGWFYQMPPLYYLYSNTEHSLDNYLPIIGTLDLQPIKTVASEISYKRIVTDDVLLVLTGFYKKFDNLIDTQTFILPDSLINSQTEAVGFAKYSNSASGTASGFEVTLQKRLSEQLSGRLSYTYMKARGTSSSAEDEYDFALTQNSNSVSEFPLSWDQRHSFVFDARFETGTLKINALYRLLSPLPATSSESLTNDTRLDWRNILDVKIRWDNHFFGGRLKPFVEIRNLFDQENIVNQFDDTGVRAYRLFDPLNTNYGRRLRLGMTFDF